MGFLSCFIRCFEPPSTIHENPSSRANAMMVKMFGKHVMEPANNAPSSSHSTCTSLMTDSYNDEDVDPHNFPTAMYAGDEKLVPNISIVSPKITEETPPSRDTTRTSSEHKIRPGNIVPMGARAVPRRFF